MPQRQWGTYSHKINFLVVTLETVGWGGCCGETGTSERPVGDTLLPSSVKRSHPIYRFVTRVDSFLPVPCTSPLQDAPFFRFLFLLLDS